MKFTFLIILLFFVALQSNAQVTVDSPGDLRKIIGFLASDSLKGRKPGTPEDKVAALFIKSCFEHYGLKSYLQEFMLVTGVHLATGNQMKLNNTEFKTGIDYIPYAISSNSTVNAEVIFTGYGLNIFQDSIRWQDYENMDVKGKWVMIFKGEPATGKTAEKFYKYSDDLTKILLARDFGAAGILFVSGVNFDKEDKLPELKYEKNMTDAGIPVIHITRNLADQILEKSGHKIAEIEKELIANQRPSGFDTKTKISATTSIVFEKVKSQNVIGILDGHDAGLKNEIIVIGAHMDHLGYGGHGSGSRKPDTNAVHNGADDNASGIAGIIELADLLSKEKNEIRRTVYFIAFGGEEYGLIGSAYFIKNTPIDLTKLRAMFNFDMIGRYDTLTKSLIIGGSGTSREGDSILKAHAKNYPFKLSFMPEGLGPSDHSSFYTVNIPVFYFTTGAHEDYHTPADDPEKINYSGEQQVINYASEVIKDVIDRDNSLVFKESGPKNLPRYGSRYKVKLGIMPDFSANDNKGLAVGGITKDGPAEKAGLLKGDIIVAIDGKSVTNIYDYMSRLEKLSQGQLVNVDIMREGKKYVFLIQL